MNESDLKKNYFELFGLPLRFDVEDRELADRYRNLQRQAHPDTKATADESSRRFAMQAAAHVNEAYRILRNPVDRAGYLLEQQGIRTDEQAASQLPPEFLTRQIQLREELEEVPGSANPHECLLELRKRIEQDIRGYFDLFREQVRREDYHAAGDTVRKLQFFHRLRNEADELQFELEAGQD